MKIFSYCNNSIIIAKNKGFVLLEAFAALFAVMASAVVIVAAVAYAATYHVEACMMRGALLRAAQTLDQALSVGVIAGSYNDGPYRVEVVWPEVHHKRCRVTYFYAIGTQQRRVQLEREIENRSS